MGAGGISLATEMFADVDDERVKFVEELVIGGEGRFEHFADFIVSDFGMNVAVALQDSASVGVDYKDGMFAGVEKDRVGGFRADSAESEKLRAEDVGGSCEKAPERACVGRVKEVHEGLERFGFLAEVAGGAEKLGQSRGANAADGLRREQTRIAQVANGAFDVAP